MALPAFDTLRIANRLKAVGVPSAQAEAEAEVLSEVFEVNLKELATKEDLRATKEDLRREIGDLRKDMDAKHESLRKDIDAKHESLSKDLFHEIRALESRLTVRLGKIVFSGVGILGTLIVALQFFARWLTPSSPRSISKYTLPSTPNFLFFDQT